MLTQSYQSAIDFASELAPDLPIVQGKTTKFFIWAEDMAEILSFVYTTDHDQVLQDLVEAVKEYQNYEDEDED